MENDNRISYYKRLTRMEKNKLDETEKKMQAYKENQEYERAKYEREKDL